MDRRAIMKKVRQLKAKYFHYHNRSIFLLDTLYNLFFLMFLLPFAGSVIKLIMKLSGISYITQENLLSFLASPYALVLLTALSFLLLLFLLVKLTSLFYYCNTEGMASPPRLLQIAVSGFRKTIHGIRREGPAPLFFTILFYILSNLPVLFGVIFLADIEFTKGKGNDLLVKSLLLLLLLASGLFSLRSLFTLHYYMNEQLTFSNALRYSRELLNGRRLRTLRILAVNYLLFTLGFFLFYFGLLFITAMGAYFFADKSLAITVFLAAYPKINLYATLFYSMFTFASYINITASLFHTYQREALKTIMFRDIMPDYPDAEYHFSYKSRKQKFGINGILLLFLAAGIFNLYSLIYHDSSYFGKALTGVTISSHRGNSHIAPENTLPALESAILANSDYAEIDVWQSKDGTLVLLHDQNLKRTAGVSSFIWELTDAQLNELDVGSWFSPDYLNTKIPTLEETLIYCKDRIMLNIEIKTSSDTPSFEEQLVALIEEYGYEYQCIVSSTNYNSLKKIKELNDEIRTGLILSAVYGKFYDKDYVDFFSIRHNFVNETVVANIHRAGKEVHVWTVNKVRDMERMKSLNVDSIITDNPSLAREILYRDNTNSTFLQLIRSMIQNRSPYRLSQALD